MARAPVDVYVGLSTAVIPPDIAAHIASVLARFSEHTYAADHLTVHLSRFLRLICRLAAYLDSAQQIDPSHLTEAIDVLDHFASTSKWWSITRGEPSFVLRSPSHDPRDLIKSLSLVRVGSETSSRAKGAAERLNVFLQEQGIESKVRNDLTQEITSSWLLLCGMACKGQGRNTTSEADFETAYDIVRMLLFHISRDDYRSLTAARLLGTNPVVPRVAQVALSPGFEKLIESSPAASLDKKYRTLLTDKAEPVPVMSRAVLTNALRFLAQLQAQKAGLDRIDEENYGAMIAGSLALLGSVGVTSEIFRDEGDVAALFMRLRPAKGVGDRIGHLARKLESLIQDSTGNRDFLLRFARLVPRMIAVILLIAAGTNTSSEQELGDRDLKRGLILLSTLLNA